MRRAPTRASSSCTAADTEERGSPSVWAARVKLEHSTTRLKVRNRSIRSTADPSRRLFANSDQCCQNSRLYHLFLDDISLPQKRPPAAPHLERRLAHDGSQHQRQDRHHRGRSEEPRRTHRPGSRRTWREG